MSFSLNIDTDNAAFEADPFMETARILRAAAEAVADGRDSGRLRDTNGNTVGRFEFTED